MSATHTDIHSTHGELTTGSLDGVRTRRIMAFLFDYVIVAIMCVVAAVAVFFFGIVTLGAGWLLYSILVPAVAITYVALTLGGPQQATWGMQFFALKLVRLDGGRIDFSLGILHSILFWFLHFTVVLLAVSLFSSRKRLIHDMLLGTMIVRSDI